MTVRATEVTREYDNASGGSNDDSVTYRIVWTAEGGFIGHGWYWGGTPITDWWVQNHDRFGYTDSEDDFKSYAARVDNLDDAFKSWDAGLKFLFLANNPDFKFDPKTGEFNSNCVSMVG